MPETLYCCFDRQACAFEVGTHFASITGSPFSGKSYALSISFDPSGSTVAVGASLSHTMRNEDPAVHRDEMITLPPSHAGEAAESTRPGASLPCDTLPLTPSPELQVSRQEMSWSTLARLGLSWGAHTLATGPCGLWRYPKETLSTRATQMPTRSRTSSSPGGVPSACSIWSHTGPRALVSTLPRTLSQLGGA